MFNHLILVIEMAINGWPLTLPVMVVGTLLGAGAPLLVIQTISVLALSIIGIYTVAALLNRAGSFVGHFYCVSVPLTVLISITTSCVIF